MLKKIGYTILLVNLVLLSVNTGVIASKNGEVDLSQYKTFTEEKAVEESYIDQHEEIFLSKEDEIWALQTSRATMLQYLTDGTTYEPSEIPEIFLTKNRKIFVSTHNTETNELRGCRGEIGEDNLLNALIEASESVTHDSRFDSITLEELPNILIEINILNEEEEISNMHSENAFERGIDGIYVERDGSLQGIYLPLVPIMYSYDSETLAERLCSKANLEEGCLDDDANTFYRFTTYNFAENPTGEEPLTLYRYNTTIEEVDRETVETSLGLVANRIHEDLNGSGKFNYIYYPSTDSYADTYNIVRHMLGSYIFIELYNYYGDEIYLEDAQKSIEFFMQYFVENGDIGYIIYKEDTAKLGTSAIAILTLLDYQETTGDTTYSETIEKLANFVLSMQKEDGSYQNYYPKEDPDATTATELYTGEANLAMARMFKATGETKYLSAVQKTYDWVKEYFEETQRTPVISWNTSAFYEIYMLTENEKYAELAFEMIDWLIDTKQYTEEVAPYPDYIGSFAVNEIDEGLTCSAAAFSEGIVDAYAMARAMGDEEHKAKYKESIQSAIKFLISMQFTEENTFYMENHDRAIGGFRASMYDSSIRIDFNDHTISTFLKAIENWVY